MAAGGERGSRHVDMMPVQSFIAQFTSACSTKDYQKITDVSFQWRRGASNKEKLCTRFKIF